MENEEPRKSFKNLRQAFLKIGSLFSALFEDFQKAVNCEHKNVENEEPKVISPHFLLLEGFNFWIQAYRK